MSIRKWLFQSALTKYHLKRKSAPKADNTLVGRQIYILHDLQKTEAIEQFKNELEQLGKQVRIFSFQYNNKEEEGSKSFTYKDLNWYRFPKTEKIRNFLNDSPDILIVLNIFHKDILTALGALSKATFKIGVNNDRVEYYNLIVDSNNSTDINEVLKNINQSLKKIAI